MKKRSIIIDLIRILASFMVIMCHVKLPPIRIDGTIDIGKMVIACIVGDGVAFFWIMSGFFAFRNEDYSKKIKNVFKTIVLPTIMLIFFSILFFDFIINEHSFKYCLFNLGSCHSKENIDSLLSGVITFNASLIPEAPHLWYVFTYIGNYFWVPILSLLFIKDGNETRIAKRIIFILSILALIFESIEQFYLLKYGHIIKITIVSHSLFLILIGKTIYDNIDKIRNNKKIRYIGIGMYLIFSGLKIWLQYLLYSKNVANTFFLQWSSMPAILDTIGLIIFLLTFDIKSNKVISYIGKATFGIYLIHWAVKEKIAYIGFNEKLFSFFNVDSSSFLSELLYTIVLSFIVFIISLLIVLLLKLLKESVKCLKKLKSY
ncbi:MAG: acyltransferase [Firmicutes bacterium]|nr:acyltransferase [Bacillota bacterium]